MTSKQKLDAIKHRIGWDTIKEMDEFGISVLVLVNYMDFLKEHNLIKEGPVSMTEEGQNVVAICDEFDWKPTDEHIKVFAMDTTVDDQDRNGIVTLLKEVRDNKKGIIDFVKNGYKMP